MFTDRFFEAGTGRVRDRIVFVLLTDNFAHVEDEFLLDCVRILANLERCRHQLILGKRDS